MCVCENISDDRRIQLVSGPRPLRLLLFFACSLHIKFHLTDSTSFIYYCHGWCIGRNWKSKNTLKYVPVKALISVNISSDSTFLFVTLAVLCSASCYLAPCPVISFTFINLVSLFIQVTLPLRNLGGNLNPLSSFLFPSLCLIVFLSVQQCLFSGCTQWWGKSFSRVRNMDSSLFTFLA